MTLNNIYKYKLKIIINILVENKTNINFNIKDETE